MSTANNTIYAETIFSSLMHIPVVCAVGGIVVEVEKSVSGGYVWYGRTKINMFLGD